MGNSFLDDLKHAWSRPNNGLSQLIIINAVVFVVVGLLAVITTLIGQGWVYQIVYEQFTIPPQIMDFLYKPWTILTYAFMHSFSNFFHIIMNMLVLYWFGRVFVDFLGSQKLINLYVLGAISGGVIYLLAYNLIPFYQDHALSTSGMVGASAAVYAITVATATLAPDYQFHLLFFGPVRIKYIALVVVGISLLSIVRSNFGGNLAHVGGAIMGFVYIKQLQKGNELGVFVFKVMEFVKSLFKPRPKIKVSYRNTDKKSGTKSKESVNNSGVSQAEIDAILDKISEKGYGALSKEEKEKLFKAGK